ncbi:Metallo-beta-lactamase superfamily protein [Prevotella melaninogenica]|uniref:MBL fold metallo-hydrolase n=1 Tax=Prevotella melaninogenica TaxID=28132 RepID=UPI00195B2B47|nr:MBL fold metallo-hydrolase [Prevotella melaninogenica]VTY07969.1 Metallo-beta-lactamase superfamily protein [Prevotella melaninogenica]
MKISFLQAGNGDCIHIESGTHHVIIDSGKYCPELVSLIQKLQDEEESIDLLVITHYDADHIKTVNSILESLKAPERKKLIKQVWFNGTKVRLYGNERMLSVRDALKLGNLLSKADIDWISKLEKGLKKEIDDSLTLELINGGEIYNITREEMLLGDGKKDWNTSFKELESYLNDRELDTSETNAQSAIIIAHCNGKEILLPGDSTPDKLSEALDDYRKGEVLKFDLVKLPHHGSYKNVTKDILEKFECLDYVVCTNGDIFYHPNKKMILKVVSWGKRETNEKIFFHLNYYNDLNERLNITNNEKSQYNFECDGKRVFEF